MCECGDLAFTSLCESQIIRWASVRDTLPAKVTSVYWSLAHFSFNRLLYCHPGHVSLSHSKEKLQHILRGHIKELFKSDQGLA
jgi:hypothetical protein